MRILKKAVTLIDIAKACDTSNVTVSKALAGKSGVSDALREKIKQVADEMGYVGVKSTQNRGGNTIGVLIPSKFINPNGSFYWALYNALVTRLKKENMFCIMENLDQEDEDRLMLPHCIEDKQVSALISLGQLSKNYGTCLEFLVQNNFVYASEWTGPGNVRQFTLCPSLQEYLFNCPAEIVEELQKLKNAHYCDLPF